MERSFMKKTMNIFFCALLGAAVLIGGCSDNNKAEAVKEQKTAAAAQKDASLSGARNTPIVAAAKKVGPAVVGITNKAYVRDIFNRVQLTERGTGSGVIYDKSGLIATNNHVVEGASEIIVSLTDGRSVKGKVLGADAATDLAVVKIDENNLPVADFGDSSTLQVGEPAIAIGNPLGLEFRGSVTAGVISALNRSIQLGERKFDLIQTDAAINPGNSGGPIFNEKNEVVGVTVSKLSNADNMGFGIRVEALRKLLEFVEAADRTAFQVQCDSCDELISEEEEFCPSCGEKLPEGIFKEREPSSLSTFCERAIREMGVNPILARDGYDSWTFHKGSSEVRIFVYENTYLFAVSPINLLPKKEVERVLDYILSEDFSPYKLGIEGRQIYIAYRVHLSDITDASEDEILTNLVNLALKADEMDNMMVEEFGCEFSEYSKHED